MRHLIILAISLLTLLHHATTSESSTAAVDAELSKFLAQVNQRLAVLYNKEVLASWDNEVRGPNDLIALLQSEIATKEIMTYLQEISPRVSKFKRLKAGESLKRQLSQIPEVGYEALGGDDLELMYAVMQSMSEIYTHAKLCSFDDRQQCNLSLVPDVQNILNASKNVEEIEYYWLEWRRKTGMAAREDFEKFVELYRKTANLNGFAIPSDFWFKDLEENSAEASVLLENFMSDLQPLFQQFHAHVRASLRQRHGPELVPRAKPYPQNLAEIFIGNAYRQGAPDWLIDLPYPEVGMPNITAGLFRRGQMNPQRVFWNVAEYFRSLGMPQIESDFWTQSAKPKADLEEVDATCWHKAWKYYGQNRVNFSYCPNVNEEQRFLNMFEAVSDLHYYRAYASQPTLFAEEPFPHFSDGLGKVFSLAASSPRYLEKLKVIEPGYISKEARINRLYVQGLRTIFLLPVFYVLDRYRTAVLDGKIRIANNCAYWELTERYTGAEPPVTRSNEDFDAPAKLLMEVDDQYTSQIMSVVLQFQVYKHFCTLTGQYKKGDTARPLDLCDLSNQREIGPILMQAMSLGASKSYKDILKVLTNETELKLDGLLEYFLPLFEWLTAENRAANIEIGWEKSNRCTA